MNLKASLRNSLAQLFFLSGLTSPARCSRGRLSIVTFHRVLPEFERKNYPFPGLVVTPEELDIFLSYFTEHFNCGAISAQHERYVSGERTERPLLAITFDDAQYDNFINARPVLAQHQVKASFFAPVAAVERNELLWHDRLGFAILSLIQQGDSGQAKLMKILADAGMRESETNNLAISAVQASKELPLESRLRLVEELMEASGITQVPDFARLMTFKELAELASDGHEIGSHSMTHCMMPECDDDELVYELVESRRVLQANLSRPVNAFCYPNGNCDARTARAVAAAGYSLAVTTDWGTNGEKSDRFRLLRCDMDASRVQDSNGNFLPAILSFRMSGFYPGLG